MCDFICTLNYGVDCIGVILDVVEIWNSLRQYFLYVLLCFHPYEENIISQDAKWWPITVSQGGDKNF